MIDNATLHNIAAGCYLPTMVKPLELVQEVLRLRKELEAAANLLAVIHRDGGHHTAAVGWAQSLTDAESAIHDSRLKHDTLVTEVETLRAAGHALLAERTALKAIGTRIEACVEGPDLDALIAEGVEATARYDAAVARMDELARGVQ